MASGLGRNRFGAQIKAVASARFGPKSPEEVDVYEKKAAFYFTGAGIVLFALLVGFGAAYNIKRDVFTYQTWSDYKWGSYYMVIKTQTDRFSTTAFASLAAGFFWIYEAFRWWHHRSHLNTKQKPGRQRHMFYAWLEDQVASWRISSSALQNYHAFHYMRLSTCTTFTWLACCPELLFQSDEQIILTTICKFAGTWSLITTEYMLQSGLMHGYYKQGASTHHYKYITFALVAMGFFFGVLITPWIIQFSFLNGTIASQAPAGFWAIEILYVVWDAGIYLWVVGRIFFGYPVENYKLFNAVFTSQLHTGWIFAMITILNVLAYWTQRKSTWGNMVDAYDLITIGQIVP